MTTVQMSNVTYLKEKSHTCVITSSDHLIYESSKLGIKPLLDFYLKIMSPATKELTIIDKTVGIAAASFIVELPVTHVYAIVISEPALKLLHGYGISVEYDELVPNIMNRDCTDLCPIEKLAMSMSSPKQTIDCLVDQFAMKL